MRICGTMARSVGRVCLARCAITPQLADVSCFFGAMRTSRPTKTGLTFEGGRDRMGLEIQSSPDKTITLRVFEYAYRVAMQHGKEQGKDYLKLDFPKTVVFYLRSDKKTPRELSIELNLPDGSTAAYTVPTKRLEEYKPEDLIKKSMLIFAPFYSMLWEKKLEQNPAALKELKAAVLFIT
ncbi:MAG: Rpn family recombination-promoting nuclease/putative transposase, partial [Oscillospiraceae bacterium]|nr:Rpn family recombination-promoting nuclease/putative transposase [Oscillospiraceae bacterium]